MKNDDVLVKLGNRFVIHDRDTIYAERVDCALEAMGLTVLKTPVRVPQANAFARFFGSGHSLQSGPATNFSKNSLPDPQSAK